MAHNEQVFTPSNIVNEILDRLDYYIKDCDTSAVRQKHIIDNSCGDGAFLKEVADTYVRACINDNLTEDETIQELETYIHGIELDECLCEETKNALTSICKGIGINKQINFDILCADAMEVTKFNGKMDYVVGNPPYCKVHDLQEKYDRVKEFSFAQDGMIDLYLVFFEIGINMLNENGKLGYITPNSWMTSKAGTNFRKWVEKTNKLSEIIQFGSYKVFEDVTTFTNITFIDNSKHHPLFKYSFNEYEDTKTGNLKDSFIDGKFYVADKTVLETLRNITEKSATTYHKIKVKNGFATLNDRLFISKSHYPSIIEKYKNQIEIYKASTAYTGMASYPYDENGRPLAFDCLDEYTQDILKTKAKMCGADTTKDKWYLYGRYQGIKDMSKYRIAINTLINDSKGSLKIKLIEPNVGIYSGLYLVCEDDDKFLQDNYQRICDILVNYDFIHYIKSLGKYKNGSYYTFSSKDLENYINYKIFK